MIHDSDSFGNVLESGAHFVPIIQAAVPITNIEPLFDKLRSCIASFLLEPTTLTGTFTIDRIYFLKKTNCFQQTNVPSLILCNRESSIFDTCVFSLFGVRIQRWRIGLCDLIKVTHLHQLPE